MNFLILGAGQTGKLVVEVAHRTADWKCVGFLDPAAELAGTKIHGVEVLGSDELLSTFAKDPQIDGALPVLGNLSSRRTLFDQCIAEGFKLPVIVDPSAVLASDARLGLGVCVLMNATILTNVEIGDFAFVGTAVSVLHDVTIGDNCVFGGGTIIGSNAIVGDNVEFGVGATVASGGFRIGNGARIAAGAVIHKNVPENTFVLGNPARVIGPSAA